MKKFSLFFFVLGLTFLVITIIKLGAEEIFVGIIAVGWIFIPITAMNFFWYASNALGWRAVYRALGGGSNESKPRHWRFILAMIAGEAINNATPFFNLGGEPVKGLLVSGGKEGVEKIAASLIIDNTLNYISSAVFITAGLFFSLIILDLESSVKYGLVACCLAASLLLTAFFLMQIKGVFSITILKIMKFLRRDSPEAIARILRMDSGIREFYFKRKQSLFVSFLWHLLARIIATFDAMFILYFMGIGVDFLTAFFIQSISILINLLFMFIPLQIGAAEGGHYLLFSLIRMNPVDGVEFSLIRRIRGIIWIAIGIIIIATGKRKAADQSLASPCRSR